MPLQPTSPLRNRLQIKKIVNFFVKKKIRSLISVSNLKNKFPVYEKKRVLNSKKLLNKKIYLNWAIYINTYENFVKYKKIKNFDSYNYKMDDKFSLDIDTFNDIRKFEAKINWSNNFEFF